MMLEVRREVEAYTILLEKTFFFLMWYIFFK